MRPDEYEHLVAQYFESLGYSTEVSPQTGDYGVDVFATKGKEKIAIQAKMYGGSTRKVNRQMIMELNGAKEYFDCTKAVLATDGQVIQNAREVADKIGVIILEIPIIESGMAQSKRVDIEPGLFESIWQKEIMPLQGKVLKRANGTSNEIKKVDWSGITRVISNGNEQLIKIEIFRKVINHLYQHGNITRDFINNEYQGRASSGIVLILSNGPSFELTRKPIGLRYVGKTKVKTKSRNQTKSKSTKPKSQPKPTDIKGVVDYLKSYQSSISEAKSIQPTPGVYAFFFVGDEFPIGQLPNKNDIIYIGKTQSSGIGRVLNTHFGTGKTGSSTVRRTLSSLLIGQLGLIPIPRNSSDKAKGRYTFKLNTKSEQTLTNWMVENLKVSFYPLVEIEEVKKLEKRLIQSIVPVLNLEGNLANPHRSSILQLRRSCAEIAFGERMMPVQARKVQSPKNVSIKAVANKQRTSSRAKNIAIQNAKAIRKTRKQIEKT